MKKITKFVTVIASMMLLAGCNKTPEVTLDHIGVTHEPTKTEYVVNEAFDPTGLEVTAYYSNSTYAIVSDYTLSGADTSSAGEKTVTVTYQEKTANFTITVNEPEPPEPEVVHVQSVSLDKHTLELNEGDQETLVATVLPADADNKSVSWSSENNNVASVDQNGVVTAVSEGNTRIAVTTEDGNKKDYCRVYVEAAEPGKTLENITVQNSVSTYNVGDVIEKSTLVVTAHYDDGSTDTVAAADYTLAYDFSSAGTKTVTVAYEEKTATFTVTVNEAQPGVKVLQSISVSGQTTSFNVGDAFAFGGTVTAHYDDDSTADVTSQATFTGYNMSTAGNYAVTVSFGGKTTSYNITVTGSAPAKTLDSISVSGQKTSYKVGDTFVKPTVTAHYSDSSTATVTSQATFTGYNMSTAGNYTVTVSYTYGTITKTTNYNITVSGTTPPSEDVATITLPVSDFPATYVEGTVTAGGITFACDYIGNSFVNGALQWKKNGNAYLYNENPIKGLKTITLATVSGKTFSGKITTGTVADPGYNDSTAPSATITNGVAYNFPTGTTYFTIETGNATGYCGAITITYAAVSPTDISLPATKDIMVGKSATLGVTYEPEGANKNLGVTWDSSDKSVATVNENGKVTVNSGATPGQTAIITATSTYDSSLTASCTINVTAYKKAAWTVMIYMCGSDLESGTGHYATSDLNEILEVTGQPDDVNIIVETGGTTSWSMSNPSISAENLERWHVENQQLVRDETLPQGDMGLQSTFESFLTWGLTEYEADKTGVILWNHGGAMQGVCIDENYTTYDDEGYITESSELLDNEIHDGVLNVLSSLGKEGEKLEWVGYDACLMAMQDIATLNADCFNYMVSAQESESGEGWDYDNWVDNLYAKDATIDILKAICDSFKADGRTNSDETLSILDLSQMDAYITAWENMSDVLATKITNSNKSDFYTLLGSVKWYGGTESGTNYNIVYGSFDAKDFINKLSNNSTFNPGSTYTSAVLTAFSNLVIYSVKGSKAGNSNGLCLFFAYGGYCYQSIYYTEEMTKLTSWRTKIVIPYGAEEQWAD